MSTCRGCGRGRGSDCMYPNQKCRPCEVRMILSQCLFRSREKTFPAGQTRGYRGARNSGFQGSWASSPRRSPAKSRWPTPPNYPVRAAESR